MYKLKEYKPTRLGFGEGLRDIAEKKPDIIGLGADITGSVNMNLFAEKFPDRFYSFGIAEQNIAGVAAGIALAGKIPFFSTYGVFAALRTTDQLRVSICYNNLNVKIGGAHAGISVGPDGATHQALEDIAIMRALPNMTVLSPCDATQTYKAVEASVNKINGPVYIRFGREAVADFTSRDLDFIPGKGQVFKNGNDIAIIATGHMTWEALQSAYQLEKEGINARVINLHTIKPIDEELIIQTAKECKRIITVEEHQIYGGLGSAVSEVLSENYPVFVHKIGMPDKFGESGSPEELLKKYNMTAHAISHKIKKLI